MLTRSIAKLGALLAFLVGCNIDVEPEPVTEPEPVITQTSNLVINSWNFVGPRKGVAFNPSNPNTTYSGTVTDIEQVPGTFVYRLASSAGGIFEYSGAAGRWDRISSSLRPALPGQPIGTGVGMAMSAVQTKPSNTQLILAGTGDASNNMGALAGAGIWRTTDGGATWSLALGGIFTGPFVYRIAWNGSAALNPNTVHAATENGYFRSLTDGQNWQQFTFSKATEVIVDPNNSARLYLAVPGVGIMRSDDSGANWTVSFSKPGFGWTKMSVAAWRNPLVLYVASDEAGAPNGMAIYRNIRANNQDNWVNVAFPTGSFFTQCFRDIAIGTNHTGNVVITGCDSLLRAEQVDTTTTPTWTLITDLAVHGDYHIIKFTDPNVVLLGNDAGYAYSQDSGKLGTWATNNTIPISNIMSFDVGLNDPNVVATGSWDTSVARTTDAGATWMGAYNSPMDPDQVNMVIDPGNANRAWATDRFGNRFRLVNGTWVAVSSLSAPGFRVEFHHDQVPGVFIYTQGINGIFKSTDFGVSWTKYPSPSFPDSVRPVVFSAGRYKNSAVDSVIYARFQNGRLGVIDRERSTTAWTDITDRPNIAGIAFSRFAVSQQSPDRAYLFSSNRIFRSSNRGWDWVEITNNFPSTGVTITDLIENPVDTNMLFVSTFGGAGIYKFSTINGVASWRIWQNGIPAGGNVIMQLKGKNYASGFKVFAGGWGTGVWSRDFGGDDP